eukprot:TRINITY_DN90268_c0_g1_i1.p1 TRINITY_DN90268_c0_g1~~TRINITY_DN90268_c0_g1_i1.p1  ORF type:complete len:557 (+),score=157.31 TRINITY_DN90268_c0_g1_i1:77-1747(+)
MVDRHHQMFRDDGSYDFKKREDWDYKHGYNFMAGWLGEDEAKAKLKKKKLIGKVDQEAPPLPEDAALVERIEKTATHVSKSNDAKIFERFIEEKNKGQAGWGFIRDGGDGHEYYQFCLHCAERQVNPRPLAQQSKKTKLDRETKTANAKANVMTMGGPGVTEEKTKREPSYKPNDLLEVVGVKSKPDYNGKIVRVIKYDADADRYEVRFEGGRYDQVIVKLKEDNMMFTSVEQREAAKDEEIEEGEIPNSTRVEIRGLTSEAARWLNGQKGIVVAWDKEGQRYEIRLDVNNDVKKVKPGNVRIELPPEWQEHWDEHLQRYYYLNTKTEKVTWKHPKMVNQRAKMGVVRENNTMDWEAQEVEVDKERVHYDVDDEEEGEGQFNLQALVRKVEEQEEKRLAAEEAGEEYVDSDDGMYSVAKQKNKKKKRKITGKKLEVKDVQDKIDSLLEHTMVGRVSMKKDYTLLEGHFIAKEDLNPSIEKIEHALTVGTPPDGLLKLGFEVLLGACEKCAVLCDQMRRSDFFLRELNKVVDRVVTNSTGAELLTDLKWVRDFLRTC